MKKVILAVLTLMASGAVMAAGENNVGSCGPGSKLFEGQSGIMPQVLAATTNNTVGIQTFGVTTGTSGCTSDGTVKSNWKTALFIEGNKERLARDMSIGHGETLASLASLIGVRDEHRATFFRTAKDNFERIFAVDNVSGEQIRMALKRVLAESSELVAYSTTI
jgi:hypothetical protein